MAGLAGLAGLMTRRSLLKILAAACAGGVVERTVAPAAVPPPLPARQPRCFEVAATRLDIWSDLHYVRDTFGSYYYEPIDAIDTHGELELFGKYRLTPGDTMAVSVNDGLFRISFSAVITKLSGWGDEWAPKTTLGFDLIDTSGHMSRYAGLVPTHHFEVLT